MLGAPACKGSSSGRTVIDDVDDGGGGDGDVDVDVVDCMVRSLVGFFENKLLWLWVLNAFEYWKKVHMTPSTIATSNHVISSLSRNLNPYDRVTLF